MTYAVVSWQATFPGSTIQWDSGSPEDDSIAAIPNAWGWLPSTAPTTGAVGTGAGSQVSLLATSIASAMGAALTSSARFYLLDPGLTLWRLDLTMAGVTTYVRLVFASIADARAWGFNETTVNAVNTTGNVWRFESTLNTQGAWSGGCSRVVQDEPDTRYRTEVASSPYTAGANTHVRLGSRDYRSVRWVYVDAAYVHALQAGEASFATPAGRLAVDPNNLLDAAVERFATGAELRLTVQGRAPYACQVVRRDPDVSGFASRVGSAGRRYDVEIEMEGST